jgi:NAD(P)-dependent dehydrogenase (short-subunit alcohol dehydrogenase family)
MAPDPKTVLVTGGARRLGAAIAEHFARRGWKTIIHHNASQDEAVALQARLRGEGCAVEIIRADLSDAAQASALIPEAVSRFGRIDCLVNSAGLFIYDNLETLTAEQLERHLKVNLIAPSLTSKAFGEQDFPDEPGVIINMLDQKIRNLNPDYLSYTIAKVGLAGLTRLLAQALAPRVRVCGIAPGVTLISGEQSQASYEKSVRATPLGRSSSIEDLLAAIDFILAVPSLTGEIITVDGGENLTGRARDVAFDVGFV